MTKTILQSLALLLLASSASAFFSPPSSIKSLCDGGFAHRRQQQQQQRTNTRTSTDLNASKAKQKAESRTAWSEKRGHGTGTTTSSSSTNDVQQSNDDKKSRGRNTSPRLIIAGAPASGKGTRCELIKSRYGVVHLSTGDMLRAAVSAGTDVGKSAKEYMDSGKLVPDEVIIGVVKERLNSPDCAEHGWLLDGFPRTLAQAKALADAGVTADAFIFLNVPDSVLVERVVGRRTDPITGKIYHMTFSPPNDDEILARLEQRSDDTEEKVKVRLEQFHANVDAVRGSYAEIAMEVDGTQKPEIVSALIMKTIDAVLV